jgi:hypothetical protein
MMALFSDAGAARRLRGILWGEWANSRKFLAFVFAAWLIGLWALVLFYHPAWILVIGMNVGIVLGLVSGRDTVEGPAEFTFSLPVSRRSLFLGRLLFYGSFLASFVVLGLAAIRLDLPQALWGLVVETGFTESFGSGGARPSIESYWYGLSLAVPLAAFGWSFAAAMIARTTNWLPLTLPAGLIGPGALAGLGIYLEYLSGGWGTMTGAISVPLLLVGAVLAPAAAYPLFLGKEVAGGGMGRSTGGARPVIVGVVVVVTLVLLFLLLFTLTAVQRKGAFETQIKASRIQAQEAAEKARKEK